MPRPTKTIRRQKTNAAIAWKKGDRKEAYKLWGEADKARKEVQAKKKKNKMGTTAETSEEGEGSASEGEG